MFTFRFYDMAENKLRIEHEHSGTLVDGFSIATASVGQWISESLDCGPVAWRKEQHIRADKPGGLVLWSSVASVEGEDLGRLVYCGLSD